MRTPGSSPQRGAVLLGVIILAALLLIGAATIGIIYVRQLNQQRQVQTQGYLEAALQGLFPGNLKKRANLNTDFGYDPNVKPVPPSSHDLKMLVDRLVVGTSDTVPAHAAIGQWTGTSTASTATLNAWNGPYWTGPVDGQNRPVDGWGRALQLRYISTSTPPGWQVFSVGANGISETGNAATPAGDDQVFPVAPYVVPVLAAVALCASPTTPFQRTDGYNPAEDITITLSWTVNGGGSASIVVKFNNGFPGGTTATAFTNIPQALITVTLNSDKRGSITATPSTFTLTSSCSVSTITF